MIYFALAAILFLVLAAAAYRRPEIGIYCITAAIPFDYIVLDWKGLTVLTNELVLAALMAGWIARLAADRRLRELPWKPLAVAAPFLLWILISGLNSASYAAALKQEIRWLEFFLVFGFSWFWIRDQAQLRSILWVTLGIGSLIALFGIMQTILGPAGLGTGPRHLLLFNGQIQRAYATFGHSNQFAGYLILLIPFAFVFFIESERPGRRILTGAMTLLLLTALVFTYSRGAWLATALAGGYLAYRHVSRRQLAFLAVLIAVAAAAVLFNRQVTHFGESALIQRVESIGQVKQDSAIRFRFLCNQVSARMIQDHPLLGIGSGNYLNALPRYFDPNSEPWKHISKHLHNLYLQIAAENGLPALLAFLAFLGYNFLQLARMHWRRKKDALLLAFIAGGAAFLLNNFSDVLVVYARGIHFSILLGLAMAYHGILRSEEESGPAAPKLQSVSKP